MKALLPPNEAERLKALARYEILDTKLQQDFDDITLLASHVCGTPIALISLVDGNRQWFKSKIGMTESETSRDIAFCAHGILHPDFFQVEDALADERFATNPLVTGDSKIRFYAGSPLVTPEGHSLGMLCVLDQVPRELSPAQKAALKALSRQVVAQLESRRSLAERKRAEEKLWQSLNLLRAITEGTTDAIFAKDREGRYLMINTAGAHFVGKKPEEMIGVDDTQCFSDETRTRIIERDRAIMKTGETRTDENISTTPAGISRVYLTTKGPLRDSTGAIIGLFGVSRDITARKRAEEALAEQAIRYKTLMETSADSIYVLNERGDLQEANAAFLRRRGYTAAEAKGLNVADWDAQWTREQLQELLQEKLRKADDDTVLETRHRCKDGSVFDVEVSATRVRIGGEQLFFCVTRDITERKLAEEALRESETRFRQLAENVSQVFWLSDVEGTLIHYVSPAYEKIWGRSCDSLYAEPVSWMDSIHSDDRERIAEDEQLQLVSGAHDHTYRIVRPDGSLRWIRARAFPVRDESGNLIRVAGIAEDITERKEAEQALRESEERFREVAENIDDVFWLSDPQHEKVLYISPAYERIWGRTRASLCASLRSWTEALHPEDRERILALLADDRPQAKPDMTYRIVRPDGSLRWIHSREFPVKDADGKVVRVAGIDEDITERKEAEEAVRKANRQLQILSRRRIQVQEDERRRLSRELHDQIGQLLTAGNINLQLARKTKDRRAITKTLDKTIVILEQILKQVRQISFDIRPPVLDDLGLAPAMRWMLDDSAARAGLAAEFFTDPNLERGDVESETACYRVGLEAVSNVVRHAHARKVGVELRNAGNALQLLVRDDGIGFDMADAEKRVRRDRLGLVGMRERAIAVGGQFECKSAPGKGTEVRALFPISPEGDRIEPL